MSEIPVPIRIDAGVGGAALAGAGLLDLSFLVSIAAALIAVALGITIRTARAHRP